MSDEEETKRDKAGWELVWRILSVLAVRGFPGAEPVFEANHPGRWKGRRLPVTVSGWRLGHYSFPVAWETREGHPYREDVVYPVYLLTDGRIVADAAHSLEPDGSVSEQRNDWGKGSGCPPWCTPAKDHGDFFEIRPGGFLPELTELQRQYAPDDRTPAAQAPVQLPRQAAPPGRAGRETPGLTSGPVPR